MQSTLSPDYGISALRPGNDSSSVLVLKRVGPMPMPVDVKIGTSDGKTQLYTIPLDIMRGAKKEEGPGRSLIVAPDWMWVQPVYELKLPFRADKILSVEIDPEMKMADINRADNVRKAPWN